LGMDNDHKLAKRPKEVSQKNTRGGGATCTKKRGGKISKREKRRADEPRGTGRKGSLVCSRKSGGGKSSRRRKRRPGEKRGLPPRIQASSNEGGITTLDILCTTVKFTRPTKKAYKQEALTREGFSALIERAGQWDTQEAMGITVLIKINARSGTTALSWICRSLGFISGRTNPKKIADGVERDCASRAIMRFTKPQVWK